MKKLIFYFPLGKLSGFLLSSALLFLTSTCLAAAPSELLPFDDITPGSMKGFGDRWNRYPWSMQSFQGDIYVGTWNQKLKISRLILSGLLSFINIDDTNDSFQYALGTFPVSKSRGGEIWKYAPAKGEWTQVVEEGFGDRFNTGYRVARLYHGKLYFGSANYKHGAQILSISDNGSSIAQIEIAGADQKELWRKNSSIRAMEVYNDKLYIGTENDEGAELWTYDEKSLTKLHKYTELSLGEMRVYGGYLFTGMWDFENGTRLYRVLADAADTVLSIDDVTPPEITGTKNLGIMSMEVFRDKLYCGSSNYRNGFTLIRFETPNAAAGDPNAATLITTDGFGEQANMYAWSLKEFDGCLYLGTFNAFGAAQLWYSSSGDEWSKLVTGGFGSRLDWGIRTMAVEGDQLFLGIASSIPASAQPGTPGGLRIFSSRKE